MKILITGATGLVGLKLVETLFLKGHTDIRILSRNKENAKKKFQFPVELYEWNPSTNYIEPTALDNVNIVIHLAGENVAKGRWTHKKKKKILDSRTQGTNFLMESIQKAKTKPQKIIGASAIGIYGDRDDESLTEESLSGEGFLADVCKKWEDKIINFPIKEVQTHILRIGIILANNGGALEQMLPPFKSGAGGKIGNGKQFMSWVHIDDIIGQIIFLMDKDCSNKIYNGVSPLPVTNEFFTKTLGKVLKRPTLIPIPRFGLKILFGEMADMLLGSQKVLPKNLMTEGYIFLYEELEKALRNILKYDTKGEKVFTKYQWTEKPPKEVFNFFANEMNLEKITPPHLNFKVLSKSTDVIQEGTIIDYKLNLHGIPLSWKSKINTFKDQERFIDEQVKGPYSKWVHTHDFIPLNKGTVIKDEVVYKVPFGLLGYLVAGSFVRNDLRKIFNYRSDNLKKILD